MKSLIISLKIFVFFTILTGIAYPFFITCITQIAFPSKANGSLIVNNGKISGSALIGQKFDSVIYFSSRPSAVDYNPLPSGGSNLGLTNEKLKKMVNQRMVNFNAFNNLDSLTVIPPEMLFASGSGLDPHISPEAAFMQSERISNARSFNNIQKMRLKQLIEDQIEDPQLLVLGEKRVNVLLLNIELDKLAIDTEYKK